MNEDDAQIGALAALQRAVALAPNSARYWTELGFTQGDLGYYHEALISLDRAIELDPASADGLNERGWVKQNLGDFAGANADYDRVFSIDSSADGARLAFAKNLVWLGQLDEAEAVFAALAGAPDNADTIAEQRRLIARIRAYQPTGNEISVCTMDEAISDKARAELVFDACTRAYLDADDDVKKADFLTVRSTARVVIEQSMDANYDDLAVAAGLDPQNGDRFSNLGFALLQKRHSWAARNDFDHALELGLQSDLATAVAMAGRARANWNLDEREAAVADARRSIDVQPNEAATWLLGDIAFEEGDRNMARDMWIATYRLGARDDGLVDALKSVGVDNPESWHSDAAS